MFLGSKFFLSSDNNHFVSPDCLFQSLDFVIFVVSAKEILFEKDELVPEILLRSRPFTDAPKLNF